MTQGEKKTQAKKTKQINVYVLYNILRQQKEENTLCPILLEKKRNSRLRNNIIEPKVVTKKQVIRVEHQRPDKRDKVGV